MVYIYIYYEIFTVDYLNSKLSHDIIHLTRIIIFLIIRSLISLIRLVNYLRWEVQLVFLG